MSNLSEFSDRQAVCPCCQQTINKLEDVNYEHLNAIETLNILRLILHEAGHRVVNLDSILEHIQRTKDKNVGEFVEEAHKEADRLRADIHSVQRIIHGPRNARVGHLAVAEIEKIHKLTDQIFRFNCNFRMGRQRDGFLPFDYFAYSDFIRSVIAFALSIVGRTKSPTIEVNYTVNDSVLCIVRLLNCAGIRPFAGRNAVLEAMSKIIGIKITIKDDGKDRIISWTVPLLLPDAENSRT